MKYLADLGQRGIITLILILFWGFLEIPFGNIVKNWTGFQYGENVWILMILPILLYIWIGYIKSLFTLIEHHEREMQHRS